MARSEVHGWNRRWSGNDTDILDRHLQRTGVARFSRTADDRYIRCFDAQDRLVMVIAPGYVVFEGPWANHECDPEWLGIALSTLGASASTPRTPTSRSQSPRATTPRTQTRSAPEPKFCPRCFLQLTTTGACGNCD